ncbi:hypothetical protein AMQ83_30080 [Paenibacillus riograndensis]|nr:hypothetical protein AMQ83_30080 [Paenibacillus riograndensis]
MRLLLQQLAAAMDSIHQAEEQKASRLEKIRVTVYVAVGLLIGYFLFVKVIRFMLRRNSYK